MAIKPSLLVQTRAEVMKQEVENIIASKEKIATQKTTLDTDVDNMLIYFGGDIKNAYEEIEHHIATSINNLCTTIEGMSENTLSMVNHSEEIDNAASMRIQRSIK